MKTVNTLKRQTYVIVLFRFYDSVLHQISSIKIMLQRIQNFALKKKKRIKLKKNQSRSNAWADIGKQFRHFEEK